MLTKWGLTNFKSIYNADIDLAALTILTGTNSSGKSSLIQSILMVAQTIRNPFCKQTLMLNGPLVKLGKPESIKPWTLKDDEIVDTPLGIRWEYLPSHVLFFPSFEINRRFVKWLGVKSASSFLFNSPECSVKDISYEVAYYASETDFPAREWEKRNFSFPKRQLKHGEIQAERGEFKSITTGPYENLDFHPLHYNNVPLVDKDDPCNDALKIKKLVPSVKTVEYEGVTLSGLLPAYFLYLADCPEWFGTADEKYTAHTEIKKGPLAVLNQGMKDFFTKRVKYLGPLRVRGSSYEFSSSDDPKDVGTSGEYTAAVLYKYQGHEVVEQIAQGYLPALLGFEGLYLTSLQDFLDLSLQFLGIASGVRVEEVKNGYELKVVIKSTNDSKAVRVDINQVGTGLSQVLPILVMCLLADGDSTLLFEQPELHLHPAIQSKLADFFIAMSHLGKQCIIETHSEYFIKKLRLRIAEEPLDKSIIHDNIKIYFCTKDGLQTEFNEVKVSNYGAKEEWPDGFFDESLKTSEAILDAVSKKQKDAGKNPWGEEPYDGYGEPEGNDDQPDH